MKFSLRHQAGLEEKLGQAVLLKLSELVGGGVIVKREIKCMSYDYNMNVYNVYDGTIYTSKGETLESLTAKLKELSLEVNETRRENVELKGEVKETRRENEELKEEIKNIYVSNSKHEDALEKIKGQLSRTF